MDSHGDEWGRKGATLSDKSARSEYGLTQDEIFAAIDAGTLQYRPAAMHGNPWLRLLRRVTTRCTRSNAGSQVSGLLGREASARSRNPSTASHSSFSG